MDKFLLLQTCLEPFTQFIPESNPLLMNLSTDMLALQDKIYKVLR